MSQPDESSAPKVTTTVVTPSRPRLSWVWLLPILAALATGWLFWSQWRANGPEIQIRFSDAPGIQAGKTFLIYRGVKAGKVTRVHLEPSLKKAVVTVRLMEFAKDIARKGTDFWVDQPEISLQQLTGLEAIVQGNSIAARVRDGPPATQFEGLDRQPVDPLDAPQLIIRLKAANMPMLARGTPVFFHGVIAGTVRDKLLDDKGEPYLQVIINEKYISQVHRNTRFWGSPAASLHLSPQGLKIETPGLETLLNGGVLFDTFGDPGEVVQNDEAFLLSPTEHAARATGAPLEVTFDEGRGIIEDETQVCYRGVAIGLVQHVVPDPAHGVIRTTVRLDPRYQHLATSDAMFTLIRPYISLDGVSGLETLATGIYIALEPGQKKNPATNFIGRTVPEKEWDRIQSEDGGLRLTLRANDIPSIGQGAPVLYHGVPVGTVVEKSVTTEGASLRVVVRKEFAGLVAGNARFWRMPATSVKAGPGVLSIDVQSLQSLLQGGIAFDVFSKPVGSAKDGAEFALAPDERTAKLESPPVRIFFENGQGLLAGETQLRYLGVPVGLVEQVTTGRGRIQVVARFEAGHDNLFASDAKFSLVRPQISLKGVSGLEALVSGVYIECSAGSAAQAGAQFNGTQAGAPPTPPTRPLEIRLLTPHTNINVEAPVFYRGLQVGAITRKILADDGQQVALIAAIDAPYVDLVRENSAFWDIETVKASLGWLSLNIQTAPLSTLLHGGVAFSTPEESKAGGNVKSGRSFQLFPKPRPEWTR